MSDKIDCVSDCSGKPIKDSTSVYLVVYSIRSASFLQVSVLLLLLYTGYC